MSRHTKQLASRVRALHRQFEDLSSLYEGKGSLYDNLRLPLRDKVKVLFDEISETDVGFTTPANFEFELDDRAQFNYVKSELGYLDNCLNDDIALQAEIDAEDAAEESAREQRRHEKEGEKFNPDVLKNIHEELDSLKSSLLNLIERSGFDRASARALKRTVDNEFAYLKEASTKVGIKDWKLILINTMILISFLFPFNSEARQTVSDSVRAILIAMDSGYAASGNVPAPPILEDGLGGPLE